MGPKQSHSTAPAMAVQPICSERSLTRSECQAVRLMNTAAVAYGMADSSMALRVLVAESPPVLVLPVAAVPASMFLMMMGRKAFKLCTHSTAGQHSTGTGGGAQPEETWIQPTSNTFKQQTREVELETPPAGSTAHNRMHISGLAFCSGLLREGRCWCCARPIAP